MSEQPDEPMVALRMPLSNWRGIVNGIEKWTGRAAGDDVEILEDIYWLNGHYDDESMTP